MKIRTALILPALLPFVFAACDAMPGQAGQSAPKPTPNPECASVTRYELPTKQVTISFEGKQASVVAELAEADAARQVGLMCRTHIDDGTGMIFAFNRLTTSGFWMFNTYVPLDILYFDRNGRVVDGARMKPCLHNQDESREQWQARCLDEAKPYAPESPYTAALELPAGWLAKQGLGDPGEHPLVVRWN